MNNIPHMGAKTIGPWLKDYAEKAPDNTAIIELGTWLGAGTKYLAEGAMCGINKKVHTYDIFKIRGNEVEKAAIQGLKVFNKQDSLPIVKEFLKKYNNICYHKGQILDAKWKKVSISVYLDDACKMPKEFTFAINLFSPFWIPEKTVVILQDFYYYKKRPDIPELICQKEWMEKNKKKFKLLWEWADQAAASFLYLGGGVSI